MVPFEPLAVSQLVVSWSVQLVGPQLVGPVPSEEEYLSHTLSPPTFNLNWF